MKIVKILKTLKKNKQDIKIRLWENKSTFFDPNNIDCSVSISQNGAIISILKNISVNDFNNLWLVLNDAYYDYKHFATNNDLTNCWIFDIPHSDINYLLDRIHKQNNIFKENILNANINI